jgi:ferric-dicitrate binding protein FerR (iron transport regulator)
MSDSLDTLLFSDDLSPAQQEALRTAMAKDPALAEMAAQWHHIRAAVRNDLHASLPDGRLFVLYALDASGHADLLSSEERTHLDRARPQLDAAIHQHPALADVVADVDDACADFEACWAQHWAKTTARKPAPDRKAQASARRKNGLRWGWRAVATVAVVAFVAVLGLLLQRDQNTTTITVAEGETRLVELADGSTVRLLGGSQLTFVDPEASAVFNRRVSLEGQAFFEITSGQQGFTVETPTALTTVLGTSFGIQADEAQMEVVLATGKISVASKAAQDRVVVLEPGQMSRVVRNAQPSTPASVDLTEALEWTGLLLFRATPVEAAIARLSEQFEVDITVAPALQDEPVSGTFDPSQPLDQILDALATTLSAEVRGDAEAGYQIVQR